MYLAVMCWLQVVIQEQLGFTPTWGCWCETNTPRLYLRTLCLCSMFQTLVGMKWEGLLFTVHYRLKYIYYFVLFLLVTGKVFHMKIDLFHSDLCAPLQN